MSDDDKALQIQLAEMRQQMIAISASIDEMKSAVKEVLVLDKQIAELAVKYRQTAEQTAVQWSRIDTLALAVQNVDKKADEWINKGRGAWTTLMILGSLVQAGVFSFIMYTFTHLRAAEDAVLLMEQKVEMLKK